MGGFGEAFGSVASSPAALYGMQGLASGFQTGSSIANAMYNAEAMRQSARAVQEQSDLQAYLIREQYLSEYKELQREQDRQQSQNRVDQAKYGLRGASANAVMQSYAAKAQKNLEQLYHNAAMSTGKQSIAANAQKAALLEKARQYDWQVTQNAIAGVMSFGAGMLNTYARQQHGTTNVDPTAPLESGTPNDLTVALAEDTWVSGTLVDGEWVVKPMIELGHDTKKP